MAMDFFEHQDRARRHTGRLVVLFVLAVLATIVCSYLVVAGAIVGFQSKTGGEAPIGLADPILLLTVSGGVIAVVLFGSMYKTAQLAGGGRVVAEMLGGRVIQPDTTDPDERRVLNVVEEMAIASGVPAPPVYLMNERGINAFAAGFAPESAVIGVTRGCIENLDRDELQGVIAHEFSHILNGDMRMNIRLIGVIHGILIIGLIGYYILRSMRYSSGGSGKKGGNPLPLIGLGLIIVGFLGTLFGNLIKSAVSRQREYLADASAVQFTRNPDGIGHALMKIGGLDKHAEIDHPNAPEASHMFFGQAVTKGFNSVFATHPPLPKRIRAILPDWDGRFPAVRSRRKHPPLPAKPRKGKPVPEPLRRLADPFTAADPGVGFIAMMGMLNQASVAHARRLIDKVPEPIRDAAHEPYGARALIYAMMLSSDHTVRRAQINDLEAFADPAVVKLTLTLHEPVASLDPSLRLVIVDMAMPALRQLTPSQYKPFRSNIDRLIDADDEVELFEWSLRQVLDHHLSRSMERQRPPRTRYFSLKRMSEPVSALLSALAHGGHDDGEAAARAFAAGAAALDVPGLTLAGRSGFDPAALSAAIESLDETSIRCKKQIVAAAVNCIAADRRVTTAEAELLRAIAESLSCPAPALASGMSLNRPA